MFLVPTEIAFVRISIFVIDFALPLKFILDEIAFVSADGVVSQHQLPLTVLFVVLEPASVCVAVAVVQSALSLELTANKRAFVLFLLEVKNSFAVFLVVDEFTFVNQVVVRTEKFAPSILLTFLEFAFVLHGCFEVSQCAFALKFIIFKVTFVFSDTG